MGSRNLFGLGPKSKNAIEIKPTAEPVLESLLGRSIFLRPDTPDKQVAVSCFGGEFDTAIASASPLVHGLIVDAGGYIGTAAIVFAEAFPNATIVTLEPSSENFSILQRNIAAYPNIIALNVALGASERTSTLRNRKTGQWGFSLVEVPLDCPSAEPIQTVKVVTIGGLLKQLNANSIDLLKLDIEGAEKELLDPVPHWVAETRVIAAETHDRIVPGSHEAFERAMQGRNNSRIGEKILSVLSADAIPAQSKHC